MTLGRFLSLVPALALVPLAMLGACTTVEGDGSGDGGGNGDECETDGDCNGDDVCDDGECVDPNPATTSGGPGPESCSGEELQCGGGDVLKACEDGEFVDYTCTDVCDYFGFFSDGCSADQCQCGDTNDPECLDGMSGFCACAEGAGSPCTDEDANALYGACHQDDPDVAPMLKCFENYVSGGSIDCSAAANACL
jgi:hypothetical protein